MEMHLFSTPGPELEVTWILKTCQEIIGQKRGVTIAYLPQASLAAERGLKETQRAFRDLARIDMIDTETMELAEMESKLRRAALACIPGGNAFLLNHRLHSSHLAPSLKKKIQNGLPLVAFSAGAVVCGPNILTSNDLNLVPTTHFDGLGLLPFNLNVHYVEDAARDDWLSEYHHFHDHAVIMLQDGAYLRITGKTTALVRGEAWCRRAGQDKTKLTIGEAIAPHGGGR